MFSHFSRRFLNPVVLFQQVDPPSGGGAGNPSVVNPQPSQESIETAVDRRIAELLGSKKAGDDPMAALTISVKAQQRLETEVARLQGETARLKAQSAPEGSVVLTGDDARAWETFKSLGKADDVKAAVAERDTLKTKVTTVEQENASIKRDQTLRDIADKAGFKFTVLKDRDERTPGLEYSIKEVEENGKKVKRAFVKFKDGEGDSAPLKEQSLAEYAETNWSDFLPALLVDASASNDQSSPRQVIQGGNNGNGGQPNKYDAIRNRNKAESEATTGQKTPSLETVMNIGPNPGTSGGTNAG